MSYVVVDEHLGHLGINWDKWSTIQPSTATDHRYSLMFLLENSLTQLDAVVIGLLSNSIFDLFTKPIVATNIEIHN